MTNDEMTFEAHKQIVKPLSLEPRGCLRVQCAARKMCACVRTVRCHLYTPHRRVHGSCHCLDAKLLGGTKMGSAQNYEWNPDSGELDNN